MDLFLIRHGESTNNALADPAERVDDPPLTDRGHRQARALATFVAAGGHLGPRERTEGAPLDELYTSPFLRTLQTTRPVAEALGMTPRVRVDICEIGGVWVDGAPHCPGLSRDGISAELPGVEIPDEVTHDGWWHGGQETPAAGHGRAIAVAADLLERARTGHAAGAPPARVALVVHGDFMSALVKALTDHLPSWGIYYEHANTAITRVRLERDLCRVAYLNRAEHLGGGDLVSP
jgi:2,3-bisphosphoglycerate-dependent phosphoglycerate mutase